MRRLIVAFLLLCLVNRTSAKAADVPVVEKIDFKGWKDCWRLRNKACELVIVPQVGRVLHFSEAGKENLFFLSEELAGTTVPADDNTWHNFGGDKAWPTQQDLWQKYAGRPGWPPPWEYDSAPAKVEPIENGLRLTTRHSPHFGAHVVREFVMDGQTPRVHVRQWHEKTQGEPTAMSLWTVAEVKTPLYALLPRGEAEPPYRNLSEKLLPERFSAHSTVLSIRNDDQRPMKVGVAGTPTRQDGWAAAIYDGVMLVQSHLLKDNSKYPDGGCNAEIYTADRKAGKYVELELLSPLVELKAGEQLRDDAVWQLVPVPKELDPEQAGKLARQVHQQALAILAKP